MDLADIHKPLGGRDVGCFSVDLYKEPGVDDSSILPSLIDLTSWRPHEVDPYVHVGSGRKVSNFHIISPLQS